MFKIVFYCCFLLFLRRVLPARPLEQPRLQVHRLAVHQQVGEYRPILRCPHGIGEHLEQVLITAINLTLCDKDSFLSILKDNIETVLSHENDTTLVDIDKRLGELQAELVKLANSKAEYDKVGDEIYRLRDEKQKVQLEIIGRDELKKRIADMGEFLRKQPTIITEYDEPLVRRLIEKVTVYEDKFTVEFKSGVNVEINE